ncbi:MAG TPA: LAGLIDADG family homing endonuclease [Pyrinomonadaceae bacterium]|nr:LAGLIDADG family homing endonuclease [Pyrinomonadaceae bacterium]
MIEATDLAWLSGIIDGEGCITARQNSIRSLGFRVTIEAVSTVMIEKVRDVLHQCGVEYRTEGPMWRERSTRPSYRVRVDKKQDVQRLCDLILPYSVVKKAELTLIKSYLDKAVRVYYSATEEDLIILVKLRELKKVA